MKWLEDFLSLAETGSFSRAAELRHVTQPAFSRRIRALENWLGTYLVDRSSSPASLTPAGEAFKEEATAILHRMNGLRTAVYGKLPSSSDIIKFALMPSLSMSWFPDWLAQMERGLGRLHCNLVSGTLHDMTTAFVDGDCDLLMCYHHASHPLPLDPMRFEAATIGHDRLLPCVRAMRGRKPLFELPGRRDAPLPLLAYSPNTYLRGMVERILAAAPAFVTESHQVDVAERLKSMAMGGHGVAFLPQSMVHAELAQRQLAVAGDDRWQVVLDIRLYRRRDCRPAVERLWRHAMKHGVAESSAVV